jgi:glutaminyl-tRNA synthetase
MTDENITTPTEEKVSLNFIHQIIEDELAQGKNKGRVHTRFPPEPNAFA